jgi:F0F1-type ATP synthase membrane subunit b/b'
MADQGLGAERYSRIEENKALAEERRAEAVLNIAKAQKEIEGLDFEQLEKIIAIHNMLKAAERPEKVTPSPNG